MIYRFSTVEREIGGGLPINVAHFLLGRTAALIRGKAVPKQGDLVVAGLAQLTEPGDVAETKLGLGHVVVACHLIPGQRFIVVPRDAGRFFIKTAKSKPGFGKTQGGGSPVPAQRDCLGPLASPSGHVAFSEAGRRRTDTGL